MTAIVDYDTGNLSSVDEALRRAGAEFTVTPGSESTVTPEFVNPTGRPLAVKLAWKTPAGVTVRDAVRSLRLKPGEARS